MPGHHRVACPVAPCVGVGCLQVWLGQGKAWAAASAFQGEERSNEGRGASL